VPTIWLSAPSSSHGQNETVGTGRWSPDTASTTAKKTIENGNPNRKRILVAPQMPSGPVNCRCIALRATWPSAAVMVKGIQSVAMANMWGILTGWKPPHRAGRESNGQPAGLHATPPLVSSLRKAGTTEGPLHHLFGDHHVVHVHVGGEAPFVGERAIHHTGLFDDDEPVVEQVLCEFVG